MPSIFTFFDYREFLRADMAGRKKINPYISYRSIADKIGISSSMLIRIFNGKRNISDTLLPKFIQFLKLRTKEAEYFTHAVRFCQARSEQKRMKEYDILVHLRSGKVKELSETQHAFYDEWYITAIRELLRIYPFKGDFHALSRMLSPPITFHEARKSVRLLLDLGLVEKNGTSYKSIDSNISTGTVWHSPAIQRFHKATLLKAIDSLETIPRSERDYSTMTMCYSTEGYRQVRELLSKTRAELARIEEMDLQRNRVYQVNLQAFPLSTPYKGVTE